MFAAPPNDSSSRAWQGAVLLGPIGLVAGLPAMQWVLGTVFSLDSGPFQPRPPYTWTGAVVVAVLSACAGTVGAAPREPGRAAFAGFTVSLHAALLCSPLTLGALGLAEWNGTDGPSPDWILLVPLMFFVTLVFGSMFSGPLGLVFATGYSAMLAALARARRDAGPFALKAAWAVIGACWVAAGGVLWLLPASGDRSLSPIPPALGLVALGAVALAIVAVRTTSLVRWLARVRRGAVAAWRIEDALPGDADLPRLFPWGAGDRVLAQVDETGEGPFRTQKRRRAVARC